VIYFRPNNDSTAGNYVYERLRASSSTLSGASITTGGDYLNGVASTATTGSTVTLTIRNEASKQKNFHCIGGNIGWQEHTIGVWTNSSDEISTLKVGSNGTLSSGLSYRVYGSREVV